MSIIDNYVVLTDCEDIEMPEPWARVDRFVTCLGTRADLTVPSGKVMEGNVYLRVVSDRTPLQEIVKQVRDMPWSYPDAVVIMAKRQNDEHWWMVPPPWGLVVPPAPGYPAT